MKRTIRTILALGASMLLLATVRQNSGPGGVDAEVTYRIDFGGSGFESIVDVATAADGTLYIVGSTQSLDLPVIRAIQPELAGGASQDAFIARINPSNGQLLYSTYFGGEGFEEANAITVDASGNAYIVGTTQSGDLPTLRASQSQLDGSSDAFAAGFSPVGTLRFATYFGGPEEEAGYDIALDEGGLVWITGETTGDVPSVGAILEPAGGSDAFLAAISQTGEVIQFSTTLGGPANDRAFALAISDDGHVVVTGQTLSREFPVVGGLDGLEGEPPDIFLIDIDLSTREISYSTRFGGSAADEPRAVTIDSEGRVYVTGLTESDDFPTVLPTQPAPGGSDASDAVLTVLDRTGSDILFSTFLGGTNGDQATDVAILDDTMVTIVGQTFASDFPGDVNRLADPGPGFDWGFATTFVGIDRGAPVIIFSSTVPSADRLDAVIPHDFGVLALGGFSRNGIDGDRSNEGYLSLLKLAELPAILPNLHVTKSLTEATDDGVLRVGERLTYTIEIRNLGGPAVDVRLTDDFPPNARLGLVSAFGILDDGRVSWDLTTLKTDESRSFAVEMLPERAGPGFDNLAFASDRRVDSDTAAVRGAVEPAEIEFLGISAGLTAAEVMDVYVDDVKIIDNLGPREGERAVAAVGSYQTKVELVDAGASDNSIPTITFTEELLTGESSTLSFSDKNLVVAIPTAVTRSVGMLTRRHARFQAENASVVDVTVGLAASSASAYDVLVSGGAAADARGLESGQFTDYFSIPPAVIRIELLEASDGSTLGRWEYDLSEMAGNAVAVVAFETGLPSQTIDLFAVNGDGVEVKSVTVSVSETELLTGRKIESYPVYPNPASERAHLEFDLPRSADIRIRLVDTLGREVQVLDFGSRAAGRNRVVLDTGRLSPGAYFYRLETGAREVEGMFVVAR